MEWSFEVDIVNLKVSSCFFVKVWLFSSSKAILYNTKKYVVVARLIQANFVFLFHPTLISHRSPSRGIIWRPPSWTTVVLWILQSVLQYTNFIVKPRCNFLRILCAQLLYHSLCLHIPREPLQCLLCVTALITKRILLWLLQLDFPKISDLIN